MKRCIETAKIYFDDMSFEIIKDLRERSFGDFEGMTHNELKDNPYYKEFIVSVASFYHEPKANMYREPTASN